MPPRGRVQPFVRRRSYLRSSRKYTRLSSRVDGEFNSILASLLGFLPSLDHLVRPDQHVRRNCQTDLLGRFQIDDELEFLRLLDRKISIDARMTGRPSASMSGASSLASVVLPAASTPWIATRIVLP